MMIHEAKELFQARREAKRMWEMFQNVKTIEDWKALTPEQKVEYEKIWVSLNDPAQVRENAIITAFARAATPFGFAQKELYPKIYEEKAKAMGAGTIEQTLPELAGYLFNPLTYAGGELVPAALGARAGLTLGGRTAINALRGAVDAALLTGDVRQIPAWAAMGGGGTLFGRALGKLTGIRTKTGKMLDKVAVLREKIPEASRLQKLRKEEELLNKIRELREIKETHSPFEEKLREELHNKVQELVTRNKKIREKKLPEEVMSKTLELQRIKEERTPFKKEMFKELHDMVQELASRNKKIREEKIPEELLSEIRGLQRIKEERTPFKKEMFKELHDMVQELVTRNKKIREEKLLQKEYQEKMIGNIIQKLGEQTRGSQETEEVIHNLIQGLSEGEKKILSQENLYDTIQKLVEEYRKLLPALQEKYPRYFE